jgi:mannose-6-phosphate isomerase
MSMLYPLKFTPIYKDKIWGGQKLRTILNKDFGNLPNCGESWEISGVKNNESVVSEGELKGKSLPELLELYKGKLVGEKVYKKFGNEFPLLIKFLDANEDLSIQVHPNDDQALAKHQSLGKTEMWYIFQADEGAKLIAGFSKDLDRNAYLQHFNTGNLAEVLNEEEVQAGDVFFIPAGRVHTIGKGICIAEIQQTSDITYRLYDFDRVDDQGQKRELHVEEALDVLDFKSYPEYKSTYTDCVGKPVSLVDCEYFTTNKITCQEPLKRDYSAIDSFVIFICFSGSFSIKYAQDEVLVKQGDSVLVPACVQELTITPSPEAALLEVYIR